MSDRKKLQGTWSIVSLEMEGRQSAAVGGRIVIKGNRFMTIAIGAEYGGTVAFDEGSSPKQFDLTFTGGPHKGQKSLGIYELDDKTWKICLGLAGVEKRPKQFATKPGSGFALETLTRGEAVAQEDAPVFEGGDAATELDGEWAMVSGSADGHAMDPRLVKTGRRVCKGGLLTVLFGGQVYMKARITLEGSNVDFALSAGGTQLGIYRLEGDTLTSCMTAPGSARPTGFEPGPGRTRTDWKKV